MSLGNTSVVFGNGRSFMKQVPTDPYSKSWVIKHSNGVITETWNKHEAKAALEAKAEVYTAWQWLVKTNENIAKTVKEEQDV